jgi:hypothetical protein
MTLRPQICRSAGLADRDNDADGDKREDDLACSHIPHSPTHRRVLRAMRRRVPLPNHTLEKESHYSARIVISMPGGCSVLPSNGRRGRHQVEKTVRTQHAETCDENPGREGQVQILDRRVRTLKPDAITAAVSADPRSQDHATGHYARGTCGRYTIHFDRRRWHSFDDRLIP